MLLRTRKTLGLFSGACLTLGVLAFPSLARAEEQLSKRARQLFTEGRALAEQGQFSEACPKLVESYQLVRGVGTEFHLADCWEHLGKTELARSLFLDVAQKTREAGQTERAKLARARAEALAEPAAAPSEPAAPPPKPEVVEVPEVVVKPQAPEPAARPDSSSSEASLPVRLRDECSELASAASELKRLQDNVAELARSPGHAARARALAEQLAQAQRELDASWKLAGQVTAQALRRAEWSRATQATHASQKPARVTAASSAQREAVARR